MFSDPCRDIIIFKLEIEAMFRNKGFPSASF
jgi:hypothetical protein